MIIHVWRSCFPYQPLGDSPHPHLFQSVHMPKPGALKHTYYSMYLIKMKIGLANEPQCMWLPCSPSKSDKEEQELPVYNRTSSKVRHLPQTKASIHPDCYHKFLGKPWEFFPTINYVSSWFHSSNLLLGFWPVEKKHWISGLICILKISCLAQPLLWRDAFFQALYICAWTSWRQSNEA